ncbi:MAG: hypothetical protein WAQ25_02480 [Candidatus Saccharimonas sp.]
MRRSDELKIWCDYLAWLHEALSLLYDNLIQQSCFSLEEAQLYVQCIKEVASLLATAAHMRNVALAHEAAAEHP